MHLNAILGALSVIKSVMASMTPDEKRMIDGYIDKLEDKYEEGSWEDLGMEFACGILRGSIGIPDYPDVETDNAKVADSGPVNRAKRVLVAKSKTGKKKV